MKALTLSISEQTKFSSSEIADDISILTIKWADNVFEHEKFWLCHKMSSLLYTILGNKKNLCKIDLSKFDGIEQFNSVCNNIVEIYFPDTVTSVYIEKANSLRKLYAKGAKSISIAKAPCLETIEYGNGLEKLSLPDTGIRNITVGKNIRLRSGAFKNCKNLVYAKLETGVDIEPGTFENCSNLREVILPDDLLVIEPSVFKNCTKLRNIAGGKKVKHIFPSAFTGCHSLKMMECKDFYRYSNLKISDKKWMDTFRPYKPLGNIKALISNFVQELKKIDIECPEKYVADNFFRETENHYGFVMEYQSRIRGWMIWSLSHNCFLATRGDRLGLHQDEIITFTLERKPVITFEDNLYLQFPMMYIDESSSLKKIERKEEDYEGYNYILEYFTPKVSLVECYRKILQKIESLDIPSIIDSYSIIERTWWQTYPGRDDSQFYERIAKSDYSDIYLDKFLPQENTQNYDNGCRPWDFNEDEETRKLQASADSEAKSRKEYAHKHYSKDEHICKLLEDYINKRIELEKDMESVYHIQAVKNFLHCRYVDYGEGENSLIEFYGYTLEDILNDNKYNEQLSWSYKHGWVEETED